MIEKKSPNEEQARQCCFSPKTYMRIEKKRLKEALFQEVVDPNASVKEVRALIRAGADVNAVDKDGKTALMRAVCKGHEEIVKLLLKAGTDVRAADKDGSTALMGAARWGYEETVKLLLKAGADVHAADRDGSTALTLAAQWGHVEAVKLLLDAGADVCAADREGSTALMGAAQRGRQGEQPQAHLCQVQAGKDAGGNGGISEKGIRDYRKRL